MSTKDEPNIIKLLEIMKTLRTPGIGCPWDIRQTFQSISHYTIEEAYEVVDAIERNDIEDLKDELGDLLLQVVFHSRIAQEQGHFKFEDVVRQICNKMIRRHPYVFGTPEQRKAGPQEGMWDLIKEQEKSLKNKKETNKYWLDDNHKNFPALTRSLKLQKKVAKVGFDWPEISFVIDKVHEELQELQIEIHKQIDNANIEEEYGDLLFVMVNLAKHLKINPESALRKANTKFIRRFHFIEEQLKNEGKTLDQASLEEMETIWNQAKKEEKSGKEHH